jgi:DNA-directed RNA polymerase I subunit RPA43
VKEIESSHDRERGFLSIEGTMLNPDDEKSLSEKELASKGIVKGKTQRTGGSRALGATSLGVTADSGGDALVVDRTKKHKHAY